MTRKLLLVLLLCFSKNLTAQVTNEGTPASWDMIEEKSIIEPIELLALDIKRIRSEDEVNDKLQSKPWRIGIQRNVDYNFNDGKWTDLPNGDRIWRILFNSPDAVGLSVNFNEFYLPEGGEIYLYNNDKTDLLGAYTATQNNKAKILGTWFVMGDKMWIEYYEPKKVRDRGKLSISSLIHGYRIANNFQKGYYNETQQKGLNDSGVCNHDVNCPIGADFETEKSGLKKAVAFLNLGNGFVCSGTLINNTAQDEKPYFLTANHCFTDTDGNPSNPASYSMRFNWISPNPVCATATNSTDTADNFTISGATLRARNENSDLMLVEINNPIPANWDVTYAGWDKSDNIPSFTVGIHHPNADIMKISRDNDSPTKVEQNAGGNTPVTQTWDITTAGGGWEVGVTEGGSSGSALFDQNGRIIGQLYGGLAACSGTNDNNQHDYYGRFAVSWDTGNSSATRLKDWLDPLSTNTDVLDSFPLFESFAIDGAISTSISEIPCGENEVAPKLIITNKGTTILTSLTVNWDIDGGTVSTINWTGSLAQNEVEEIVLSPITLTSGSHIFNVSSASPNGVEDQNKSNNTTSTTILLTNEYETSIVKLSLTTDDWSDETSWQLRNRAGSIVYSGGPYNGTSDDNTTFDETFEVEPQECYTFEIFDAEGDGICCNFGNGWYSLFTDNNTIIFNGSGQFSSSETTNFKIINNEFRVDEVVLYPNPTSTGRIFIKGFVSGLQYSVYNFLGQTVRTSTLNTNEINLSDLVNSIYFIRITEADTGKSLVKKIVVGK